MWGLLVSTILTSAADSLNPIAITQQFVLQGMVKKPNHIWYFILPTGLTNLAGGFLAYFGFVAFIGDFAGMLIERYGQIMFLAELVLGIAFLVAVCYLIQNTKTGLSKKKTPSPQADESLDNDEAQAARKIKSVSPVALLALGVGATISELATALPYFAFLAILFNYQLSLPQLTLILVVYNFIYTSPLMILYFVYRKAQDKFDRLYAVIKAQITKWANVAAPAVAGMIGIFLVVHSITALLR